ncbi:hypothetical protein CLOM_g9898 [Closterium sp. NIES-68]|nr:hypothetical protein CLOM_g9898 [Closterium sp. NIES-68]
MGAVQSVVGGTADVAKHAAESALGATRAREEESSRERGRQTVLSVLEGAEETAKGVVSTVTGGFIGGGGSKHTFATSGATGGARGVGVAGSGAGGVVRQQAVAGMAGEGEVATVGGGSRQWLQQGGRGVCSSSSRARGEGGSSGGSRCSEGSSGGGSSPGDGVRRVR